MLHLFQQCLQLLPVALQVPTKPTDGDEDGFNSTVNVAGCLPQGADLRSLNEAAQ
jgi:hypothetical protein